MICEHCKKPITSNNNTNTNFNKYTLLCKPCIKTQNITISEKEFIYKFNITPPESIYPIYIKNATTNYYYKKHINTLLKKINKTKQEHIRREELKEVFKQCKLDYYETGDCYSYIYYNTPPISQIITNENNKLREKFDRRIELANLLNTRNIMLDESVLLCKSYISNGGDINKVVKNIEINHKMQHNKNYNNAINKIGYNKALKMYKGNNFGTIKF